MRFGHRFESRYGVSRSTLNDDLIVAWPLDEASGTRYPDYGGSAFDLTDVNTVGTADAPPGIGGLCANFNGSSEYLYCADPFPPPAALSVFAWVNASSVTGVRVVCSQDGLSERSWNLYLNAGVVECVLSADGTAFTTAQVSGAISTSAWYLVGFAWDGAKVTAYKNVTPGTPLTFASALFNSPQQVKIGAFRSTPFGFFAGRIAQPLIWSRALTLTEITYLYNSGSGRPLSDWLA